MNRTGIAAIAALALIGGACGAPAGPVSPVAKSSPAPGTPGSPTPATPTSTNNSFDVLPPAGPLSAASVARLSGITCSGAIGGSDPVAVVTLHTGAEVLRDYSDPAHPRTVCNFPIASYFGIDLIDAHHILISGNEAYLYAVVDLPSLQYRWFQLPNPLNEFPTLLAVSPALDAVAYLTPDLTNNTDKIHIVTKSGDRVVAALTNPHGGRCGSPEDSRSGAYTHSGKHLFVLDQPFPTLNSLLVLQDDQTQLLLTPPGQLPPGGWAQGTQPAMAVWSPTSETLYYRKDSGVWRWTAGAGATSFLPGVNWYYPTISADGNHLAYSVVRADGLHNVYLVDLAHGGSPQLIGKSARNLPAFLNSTQLWYRSEAQGICGPGGNAPFIYDLADGSEAPSIIDFVGSVWPATSSNF